MQTSRYRTDRSKSANLINRHVVSRRLLDIFPDIEDTQDPLVVIAIGNGVDELALLPYCTLVPSLCSDLIVHFLILLSINGRVAIDGV